MADRPPLVQRLSINTKGRCFVVTDVHFQVKKLMEGLTLLNFDPLVDRLIIGGDLVDRGPDLREALDLLGLPWVFMVRGNHEQMVIDAWKNNRIYSDNGATWWMSLSDESQDMVATKLDSLPHAIEIECEHGIVGVVHANVPSAMTWQAFIEALSYPGIQEKALWQRERITRHLRSGVEGVWRLCIGHTYLPFPQRLGNVLALDCTTGNGKALAIYCVQDDTIYVNGKPTLFEDMPRLRSQAQERHVESPSGLETVTGQLDRLNDDIHLLLAMNNSLTGILFQEDKDRADYIMAIRKRFEGTRVAPMLENLLHLVNLDA